MTAGELCNRTVYIIREDESVSEAAQQMHKHHVGCLVVVAESGGERIPVGVVTDRDLVIGVLAADPTEMQTKCVGDVMSKKLITATESEDLYTVRKRMRSRGIRRVPIVDANGVLQGIIAFDDILEWLAEQLTDLAVLVSREQKQEAEAP